MANIQKLLPFILKMEQHFTNIDTKIKDLDYNTVYGLHWNSYNLVCKRIFNKDAIKTEFLNLSQENWSHIFKSLYWDPVLADMIISDKVAFSIVDFFYKFGTMGIQNLQKMLNIEYKSTFKIDGVITTEIIEFINKIDPNIIFESIHISKMNFISTLSTVVDTVSYTNRFNLLFNLCLAIK